MTLNVRDATGKTVNVHDTLNGIALSLKHSIYQLESAGASSSPHPACWTASTEHLKSVTAKLGQLCDLVAAEVKNGAKTTAGLDPEDVAVINSAAKHLKQISKSMDTAARNARNTHSCLGVIGESP